MWTEIKKIKSTVKELREFGIVMAVFFLLLTGFLFWRHHTFVWGWTALSSAFLLTAFLCPQVLIPIQKGWMVLALLIGWVMSRVILTLVFLTAVIPIGLILKMTKKDFMPVKPDPNAPSYWRKRTLQKPNACEMQF